MPPSAGLAGISFCNTSQCSANLPPSIRKRSTTTLRCVRPAADAAVNGDEIAFGDHETGFVIACLRQAGDQRRERITTLGNVWIVLDVVTRVEALHCRRIMPLEQ